MLLNILIGVAILVGIILSFLLYKAAHIKKEVIVERKPDSELPTAAPEKVQILDAVQEKVRKIASSLPNADEVAQTITKVVEEQAQELVKDIRQEYAVKYQVAVQEKDREIETAKRKLIEVKQQFDEVEKVFKKTEEEKKTTEAVVRSIAEGLVVVNEKGDVLLMNPSAEKLLGVQKNQKVGKNIMDDISDEFMVSLSKTEADTGEKVVEYKSKNENTKKILRSSSAVIQNENGQTVGMVNILTDITKQKELDELKARFLSNITHEFRTPIVAMQKAIALVINKSAGPLNDNQSNFLGIVSRNMALLSRLVEDLLDMAKIDSGKMLIHFVPSRVDKVVSEVCDTLDTWAKTKQIEIVRDIEKNFPDIPCDPGRITQVLNNLISNAIKFTPAGGKITVRCAWTPAGDFVEISVKDTGAGISKEDQARLFRRFEQFGDQQGIIGTGLGLSIAKEIVEKHGGTIRAESELKKGSTFMFTIPARQRGTAPAAAG